MKIELWWIGKTSFNYLEEGIQTYVDRLKHYTDFNIRSLNDIKNASKMKVEQLKKKEAELVLSKLPEQSLLILLDEKGKEFSSKTFSDFINNKQIYNSNPIVFLVGGAFGFDKSLYDKAEMQISLSKMTFSHQMIRLFFVEQLYRAFTIINNEKYHNS